MVKNIGRPITVKVIEAVECSAAGCGKICPVKDESFFTVYGNICIGVGGGIVGDNLSDDDAVNNAPTYCCSCLIAILKRAEAEAEDRRVCNNHGGCPLL